MHNPRFTKYMCHSWRLSSNPKPQCGNVEMETPLDDKDVIKSSMYSQDLVILHWIGNYTYKSYCEKHWKLVIHRDRESGLKKKKIVQLQNL
jgi:hypothetical protein